MNRSETDVASSVVFFVGHPPMAIGPRDDQWHRPLPLDRAYFEKGAAHHSQAAVTYGDYFTAVVDFLTRDRMAVGRRAVSRMREKHTNHAIEEIRIHLVKHGNCYHPAMVILATGGVDVPIVVNVAVSREGQDIIAIETECLKQLSRRFADHLLPEVYHFGAGRPGSGGELPMFAGEWFSHYHEFHLAHSSPSGANRHVVWDPDQGHWQLSETQSADLYRQAMLILTCHFDPYTLSAIQHWHHAAGDFVVKATPDGIDLRLITVRRCAPLLNLDTQDPITLETLLETLAVFFLRTSLWMRIDRIDGVGELIWAGEAALAPIWKGFGEGLEKMAGRHDLPPAFAEAAKQYLASHTREDLVDLGLEILNRYPRSLPEATLIQRHLKRHAEQIQALMHTTT
ncbi:hypothetical protein [Desulfatitalea tepidiphila]|uniref:hypothetical protein n=1 Tax=Desulfatitalea tepidiphila TaxID=1185843 RepID=UPI0006B6955B|nr:hypothetical protein [Desulfatitalea tepidiphila]